MNTTKVTPRTTDQQLADLKVRFGVPEEWIDWDMRFGDPDSALRNDGFAEGQHGSTLFLPGLAARTPEEDEEILLTCTVNSELGVFLEMYLPDDEFIHLGPAPSFSEALILLFRGNSEK